MSINANYFLLYSLQQYFVDKTTGTPLAAGKLYFYQDNSRTTLKNIYKYDSVNGYTALPNPITLSAVGTPTDANGNDVAIYVFPWTDSTATVIDRYYIVCQDSSGLQQFTREAIPNIDANMEMNDTNLINYVPNGQFLLHNNIPATNTTPAGEITQDITTIAPGGWTYERSDNTSTDTVIFTQTLAYTDIPPTNPRYSIRITSTSASNTRGLRLKFNDVNKFAGSDTFTNAFYAISNSGSDLSGVTFNLIKNYGTGTNSPSSTDTIQKGTFTIPKPDNIKNNGFISLPFSFGTNDGKIIGTNDDDFLQLEIKWPTSTAVDVTLTDFILTPENITITTFPITTDEKFSEDTLAGSLPVPDYAGQNLYLPIVVTPTGLGYSSADIGKIFAGIYNNPNIGELICDGSRYETATYSSDGIPYLRLHTHLYDVTNLTPLFGTGSDYITGTYTNLSAGTTSIRLSVNGVGAATISDGSPPTGFTFSSICTGINTGCTGYVTDGNLTASLNVIANTNGTGTVAEGSTATGFTFSILRNTSNSTFAFNITTVAGSSITAGSYFTFTNPTGNFYIWFTVNGSGSDPAIGGSVGIQVNIQSTYLNTEIARVVKQAISGYQTSLITFPAASGVTEGTTFKIITPATTTYYVWYTKNGIGTDPNPGVSNSNKISVNVNNGDSSATVTTNTLNAINFKYFAIPDLSGAFLRGATANDIYDPDLALRMSMGDYFSANLAGSKQLDQFFSHTHSGSTVTTTADGTTHDTVGWGSSGTTGSAPLSIAASGGNETRPINMAVNWFIKY